MTFEDFLDMMSTFSESVCPKTSISFANFSLSMILEIVFRA